MVWGFYGGENIFDIMQLLCCVCLVDSCWNGSLLYSRGDVAPRLLIKLATHAINILNKPQIRKGCLFVLLVSQQRNCAAQFEMDLMALNSVCLF